MAAFWCRANYGVGVVVESVVLRLHLRGMGALVGGADWWLFTSEVGTMLVFLSLSGAFFWGGFESLGALTVSKTPWTWRRSIAAAMVEKT